MKVQLAHVDLLQPLPTLCLKAGYAHLRIWLRIGDQPIADINIRPRGRELSPSLLVRRVAKYRSYEIMRALLEFALQAGVDRLPPVFRELPPEVSKIHPIENRWPMWVEYVREQVLSPKGLQKDFAAWVKAAALRQTDDEAGFAWPAVCIAVPTADRPEHIPDCIAALKKQDYPNFTILIADNSRDPTGTHAAVAAAGGVEYLRVPERGASHARNAVLESTPAPWIAFTDDDCRPEANWLRELVRTARGRPSCACVTGLVLPAHLDGEAELTFENYGGLSRGYGARSFAPHWLRKSRTNAAPTWDIGASANMLVRRSMAREVDGFDPDLGAGVPAACSEDTDFFYKLLKKGRTIEYTPKAILHHFHRCSPGSLRKQIHNYARGHAAYHLKQAVLGDRRSAFRLAVHLPRSLRDRYRASRRGQSPYPLVLLYSEMCGTISGPWLYAKAKLFRSLRTMRRSHNLTSTPTTKAA